MQRFISSSEERTRKIFKYSEPNSSKFDLGDFIDRDSLDLKNSERFLDSTIIILNYSNSGQNKNFQRELFGDSANFIIYEQQGKYKLSNKKAKFSPSVSRYSLLPLFITFISEQHRDEAMNTFLLRIKDRNLPGYRIIVKYDKSIFFEDSSSNSTKGNLNKSIKYAQNIKETVQNHYKLFKGFETSNLNKFIDYAENERYNLERNK